MDLISRFPSCSFFFLCVADSFLFKAFFTDNSRSADKKNHSCKTIGNEPWIELEQPSDIQNEANFTMAHVELDDMSMVAPENPNSPAWSAWDWGLVGQWKLKLTAPCCCIVLDGRSEKIVCVAQRRHCGLSEVLKKKPVSIYILFHAYCSDLVLYPKRMIIFIFTMKCPLFGGCHTVTSSIYINLLADIATTPTRRGDSSVRGASGRCHAIGMAAGPGEFPGASKTYAIACGWRLVPTPWAKTRQQKGMVCFHWSCGLRSIDPRIMDEK